MAQILTLMAVLLIGLWPGAARAQTPVCNVMWNNSNAAVQEDLHMAMMQMGLLEQNGRVYPLRTITEVIHQHVSANCAERYNALPADRRTENGYMGHLLGLNPGLMPAGSDGRVSLSATIPKDQFMRLIAGPGINLGLPGGSRSAAASTNRTATPSAAPKKPRTAAPVRRTPVIPGCPSCVTKSSD